jgi:periplasmic divalent cation tolerance protein
VNEEDYVVVITTCPNAEQAAKLAEMLIKQQLAACVQASDIVSTYRWQGVIETAKEVRLMIKARSADYEVIESFIRVTHPYENPEILALPVMAGSRAYLEWIDMETRR